VRRAGVTDAINELEGGNLIRASRGRIFILNRAALQATAKGTYGMAEKEYKRDQMIIAFGI
jgi:transketolase